MPHTAVPKMTKQSERKLLLALEDVSAQTDEGMDPSEAIAKAASAHAIPAGQIPVMVTAYNNGRAAMQLESSEDVWDKSANYPVATAAQVLSKLYPDTHPTQASTKKASAVSTDYALPPTFLKSQSSKPAAIKKAAAVPATQPLPPSYEDAKSELAALKVSASEAHYRAAYAMDEGAALLDKLASYFLEANAEPFLAVRQNALILYGQEVASLLDSVQGKLPTTKQASSQPRPVQGPAYELIPLLLESKAIYQALKEDYLAKAASLVTRTEELADLFVPIPAHPIIATPDETALPPGARLAFGIRKQAAFGMLQGAYKTLSGPESGSSSWLGKAKGKNQDTASEAKKDVYKSLYKDQAGQIERDLGTHQDALERQTALADLMASDEVLKHHDPHQVLQAYSGLSQLAPRATTNREVLRTLLRDRLEKGQQGLFDIDALTKVEKNLGNIQSGQYDKTDGNS